MVCWDGYISIYLCVLLPNQQGIHDSYRGRRSRLRWDYLVLFVDLEGVLLSSGLTWPCAFVESVTQLLWIELWFISISPCWPDWSVNGHVESFGDSYWYGFSLIVLPFDNHRDAVLISEGKMEELGRYFDYIWTHVELDSHVWKLLTLEFI